MNLFEEVFGNKTPDKMLLTLHNLKRVDSYNQEEFSIEATIVNFGNKGNFGNYWVDIIKRRYSTEPKYRKYVKGYDLLSFARKFNDKYDKKLMDTATKTEIDAAKAAPKRVV